MEIFFNEHYTAMWDAISSIMAIFATSMATFALIYSIRTYKATMQTVHYGEIDRMYFEILKEALAKPHLSRGHIERTGDEAVEYDIYAFIVWNFLEAIYDRCQNDPSLQTTWYPIIQTESATHSQWIERSSNRRKFKESFLHFIKNEGYLNVNVIFR